MRVENGHGKNKPNIRKFAENDMADGFNSDGLDCESGGQKKTVKVGTRGSMLALAQTELVIKALKKRFSQIDFQMITMSTRGDRDTSRALLEFGGKAVFVEEFEEAILKGDIDIAVHSAKDMPMYLNVSSSLCTSKHSVLSLPLSSITPRRSSTAAARMMAS